MRTESPSTVSFRLDFIVATGGSIRAHCKDDGDAQALADCRARYANLGIGSHKIGDSAGHKVHAPGVVPLAPEDLSGVEVSADGRTLSFRWRSQADVVTRAPVTGYRVEMSEDAGDGSYTWTEVGPELPAPADPGTSDNVFIENDVPWETTRHYRVFALSRAGDSPASETVSGTTPAEADVPARVTGVTVTPGAEQLTVGWTAVTGATDYRVRWKSGSQSYSTTRQATATGTSHTITGLTAGTAYDVRVTAYNNNLSGPASATVSGTPDVAASGGGPTQPPDATSGAGNGRDGDARGRAAHGGVDRGDGCGQLPCALEVRVANLQHHP